MTWTAGADVATGDVLSAATWNSYMGNSGSIMETGVAKVTTAGDCSTQQVQTQSLV
jgi:hypothetical protein